MRTSEAASRLSGMLLLSGILAVPASAETIAIACAASPVWNAPAMTLVYEGEAKGTLTITAPFGEMRLPGRKEQRQGTDDQGQPTTVTGIRASGPARVTMPEKAAIEACVKGQLKPDELTDSDIVSVSVMACASEAPLGAEPVEITASAEIALLPEIYVGLSRAFAEPTDLAVGKIALEAYPKCTIKE